MGSRLATSIGGKMKTLVFLLMFLTAAPVFAQDPIGRVSLPVFQVATTPQPTQDLLIAVANLQVQVNDLNVKVAAIQANQAPSALERVLTSSQFWVPFSALVTFVVGRYVVPKTN